MTSCCGRPQRQQFFAARGARQYWRIITPIDALAARHVDRATIEPSGRRTGPPSIEPDLQLWSTMRSRSADAARADGSVRALVIVWRCAASAWPGEKGRRSDPAGRRPGRGLDVQ